MSVHETYFLDERRICPNCFVHIRDIEPRPHPDVLRYRLSGRTLLQIVTVRTRAAGDGHLDWVPPTTANYGIVTAPSHPQYVCHRCGVIDPPTDPRPIADLIRDGLAVCDWLEGRGVEVDRDRFFDTLREMKKDTETQNRDVEVISASLEAGVHADVCETA